MRLSFRIAVFSLLFINIISNTLACPVSEPFADLVVRPHVITGKKVMLDASNSFHSGEANGDYIISYKWGIYKGSIFVEDCYDLYGDKNFDGFMTYVFTSTGVYTVKLKITDNTGLTDTCEVTIEVSNDSDQDGLADAWEIDCFSNLNYTSNADNDMDGYSNHCEYLHDTNANDNTKHPLNDGGNYGITVSSIGDSTGEITDTVNNVPIQQAIDLSINDDVIVLLKGTYSESIDYDGKAITITSTAPMDTEIVENTVVDATSSNDYAVTLENGEMSSSVLEGLTITGGFKSGICCKCAAPVINRCVIENNGGTYNGGGLYLEDSSAVISNCFIKNNIAGSGGAVYISGNSSPAIINCVVYDNVAVYGGAIFNTPFETIIEVINCTIADNTATTNGASICQGASSGIKVYNSILYGESSDQIYGGGSFVVSNCYVSGGYPSGTNILSSGLEFNNLNENDYSLAYTSSGIDYGDNSYFTFSKYDINGLNRFANADYANSTEIDLGAYELPGKWYVDSALTANGDGSVDNEFKWFETAVMHASEGDIIVLKPGTYEDLWNWDVYADPKSVTFTSEDPESSESVSSTIIVPNAGVGTSAYLYGAARRSIIGCTIKNGTTGGISCSGFGLAEIKQCVISNNSSSGSGGGIYVSSLCYARISDCEITGNDADTGGGIYCALGSIVEIDNCKITGNSAFYDGGGVHVHASFASIKNSDIRTNTAGLGSGDALYSYSVDHEIQLVNCLITDNDAGIYASGPILITNCSVVDNNGVGIYGTYMQAYITNSIFWGNQGGGTVESNQIGFGVIVNASYSCIQDTDPDDANIPFDPTGTNHNIDDNPLFLDTDYRLTADSPCINTGNDSLIPEGIISDLDGEMRTKSTVDMGAYETYHIPTEVSIGDGFYSSSTVFYTEGYYGARTQLIYLASEFNQSPRIINYLTFDITQAPGIVEGLTIRIVNTDKSEFSSTSDWFTGNFQVVYEDDEIIDSIGSKTFAFDAPFYYTGNNLLIDISFKGASSYVYGKCKTFNSGGYRRLTEYSSDPYQFTDDGSRNYWIPNIEIGSRPVQMFDRKFEVRGECGGAFSSIDYQVNLSNYSETAYKVSVESEADWYAIDGNTSYSEQFTSYGCLSFDLSLTNEANLKAKGFYTDFAVLTFENPNDSTDTWTDYIKVSLYVSPDNYVSTTGSDTMGDGSETNPYATIQKAIDETLKGFTVYVQPGTYNEKLSVNKDYLTIKAVSTDPTLTVIDGSTYQDNVAIISNVYDIIIQGFKIANAYENDYAGVYCEYGSVNIKDCMIVDNNGLGIKGENASIIISDCIIDNNNDYEGGFGIDCQYSELVISNTNITNHDYDGFRLRSSSMATIYNSEFKYNSQGIDVDSSTVYIDNCIVSNNTSDGICTYDDVTLQLIDSNISNNAQYGLKATEKTCSAEIFNCEFNENNQNYSNGYALEAKGEFLIEECEINSNYQTGLHIIEGNVTIKNSEIIDNVDNGVLINEYGSAKTQFHNCLIADNGGSSIYACGNDVKIENCTIANNTSYAIDTSDMDDDAKVFVQNSIIWDNNSGTNFDNNFTDKASVNYSCIQGNPQNTLGVFNVYKDPDFVDENNGDYHLQNYSLCIDGGNPLSDYSNEANPNGGIINMGCYGNTAEATIWSGAYVNGIAQEYPYDSDGDGIRDTWEKYYWSGDLTLHGYDSVNDTWFDSETNQDGFNDYTEYLFGYSPDVWENYSLSVTFMNKVVPYYFKPAIDNSVSIGYVTNKPVDVEYDIGLVEFTINTTMNNVNLNILYESASQIVTEGINYAIWQGESDSLPLQSGMYGIELTATISNPFESVTISSLPDSQSIRAKSLVCTWPTVGSNVPVEIFQLGDDMANTIPFETDDSFYDVPVWFGVISSDYSLSTEFGFWKILKYGDDKVLWNGRKNAIAGDVLGQEMGPLEYDGFRIIGVFARIEGSIVVNNEKVLSNIKCNPFCISPVDNDIAEIRYTLTADTDITIDIYDSDGNYFTTLLDEVSQLAGEQVIYWHGREYQPEYTNLEEGVVWVLPDEDNNGIADTTDRYLHLGTSTTTDNYKEGDYMIIIRSDEYNSQITGSVRITK